MVRLVGINISLILNTLQVQKPIIDSIYFLYIFNIRIIVKLPQNKKKLTESNLNKQYLLSQHNRKEKLNFPAVKQTKPNAKM